MNEQHTDSIKPSEFMRKIRPDCYSDSSDNIGYELDKASFDHFLETITSRNQTHDFESFCRKLCERTICPNLRPPTGPEGGGDSKADTETIPTAEEISAGWLVGHANGAKERWAFAISAKRKWSEKVRTDVNGIVETGRNYDKVFFITSRYARSKDRSRIEDELSEKYKTRIVILDRTWILEKTIDEGYLDLAYNYLGAGKEVRSNQLGPHDYSRKKLLAEIESNLNDPEYYVGMEYHKVTDLLLTARLSRNLELSRIETDGRFERVIRFAESEGTLHQQIQARYEKIWTAFWWYDDIETLKNSYDSFEQLSLESDYSNDVEYLCNLLQLLFNSLNHNLMTEEEAQLDERVNKLLHKLETLSTDSDRPNNALEAKTSILIVRANLAVMNNDSEALPLIWKQFSELITQANGMMEYSADKLSKIVGVFGEIAGTDREYASLIDQLSEFISNRTSEAQGALILLRRAKQIGSENHHEVIRLLGKASTQLAKKEYRESFIEAMILLALSYRSIGLLWAARSCNMFSASVLFNDADMAPENPAYAIHLLIILAWTLLELRHLPDLLEIIRLINGALSGLPLQDEYSDKLKVKLRDIDGALSCRILCYSDKDIESCNGLPEVFDGLAFYQTRMMLLYRLGYELELRDEGTFPSDEPSESIEETMDIAAAQPVCANIDSLLITNVSRTQHYSTKVLGISIKVEHENSDIMVLVAETVISAIEAFFATTAPFETPPFMEQFTIVVQEHALDVPVFSIDNEKKIAILNWPKGLHPMSHEKQDRIHETLVQLVASVFACACSIQSIEEVFSRFFEIDAVLQRIGMMATASSSHQRLLNQKVSRLSDWESLVGRRYPLKTEHPTQRYYNPNIQSQGNPMRNGNDVRKAINHKDVELRSVIDVPLWDRAKWTGTAYADWQPPQLPPAILLMFEDRKAAIDIFSGWRHRFGEIDKNEEIYIAIIRELPGEKSSYYKMLITSNLGSSNSTITKKHILVTSKSKTMIPETDTNLNRFLEQYRKCGFYGLMPVIPTNGDFDILSDYVVYKRNLNIKKSSEISETDIEKMAFMDKQ